MLEIFHPLRRELEDFFEDETLHRVVMYTSAAASEFDAVDYEIVVCGFDFEW